MNDRYQVCEPLTAEERESLKASIAEHGVRVPIEVDEEGNILDGHNRFDLAQELGVPCPITVKNGLGTDEQKRAYARELNCARRQMTTETKKKMAAEQLLETGGRWSNRRIADVVGLSKNTVDAVRLELIALGQIDQVTEVETADGKVRPAEQKGTPKHEWMRAEGWQDWHRMEALSHLKRLTDDEKQVLDAVMGQRPRSPKDALRMLETAANFSPDDRGRMVELWGTEEEECQRLVVSRLAGVAPVVDPRIPLCVSVLQELASINTIGGPYPEVADCKWQLESLIKRIKDSQVSW